MLLAMAFTVALYVYTLKQLHQNDTLLSKWRQSKAANKDQKYLMEVFGLKEVDKNQQSLAMRQFLPFHYEMLFIVILVTFSKYADIRAQFLQR